MLGLGCRRYLRRARPGDRSRHRRHCSSCDHYLRALEVLVTPAPLSPKLRRRLFAVPGEAGALLAPRPVPLPKRLRRSLADIAPHRPRRMPSFVGSPVYSLAASYLLVLLIGVAWGNPYPLLEHRLASAQKSATSIVENSNRLVTQWVETTRSRFRSGSR